jgi:flagellin-specific chaperone FliS
MKVLNAANKITNGAILIEGGITVKRNNILHMIQFDGYKSFEDFKTDIVNLNHMVTNFVLSEIENMNKEGIFVAAEQSLLWSMSSILDAMMLEELDIELNNIKNLYKYMYHKILMADIKSSKLHERDEINSINNKLVDNFEETLKREFCKPKKKIEPDKFYTIDEFFKDDPQSLEFIQEFFGDTKDLIVRKNKRS